MAVMRQRLDGSHRIMQERGRSEGCWCALCCHAESWLMDRSHNAITKSDADPLRFASPVYLDIQQLDGEYV